MESLFNLSIIKLGKNTLYILQDIISLLKKKKKKKFILFISVSIQFKTLQFACTHWSIWSIAILAY